MDKAGVLRSNEDLSYLCTSLCFKLKVVLPPGEIESRVEAALESDVLVHKEGSGQSKHVGIPRDAFQDWFYTEFSLSERGTDLVSSPLN